jgi:hypothetical protein
MTPGGDRAQIDFGPAEPEVEEGVAAAVTDRGTPFVVCTDPP